MKDPWRDRFPSYIPWRWRLLLQLRKVCRQSLTRWQEQAAAARPPDPLLDDGEPAEPIGERAFAPNPREALTKCAQWHEEDLQRPDLKAVADQLNALRAELTAQRLRFTNTAGTFLAREYHPRFESGKLWEAAWTILHSRVAPAHEVLDIGGASSLFSFYLASLGCRVTVLDNDWANCGILLNARHVARRMGWRLSALDRDVSRPLPFADEAFDRVFSICVLEHLPPRVRQGLMREIGRVLKPGGIAAFTMDYDHSRPLLLTDKGLRFAYRHKLERDVIRPSGLRLHGPADWTDAYAADTFLGALFLEKPLGHAVRAIRS
ncbi:MAG: class I SAM-dependent methyltransferase [Candidatus Omnitrophica bacterium]|nr:class I SAM-dependent methyltransferase [Candidatus Omnitrophota bacterium]